MAYDAEALRAKSAGFRKTAYIRFDLAERLQVINFVNLIVSVLLTVYLSGWAIFVAFFPRALISPEKEIVSYVSVMATIALMCLTILDYMADRSVKARAFLQCGNRILKISDDLDFAVAEGLPLAKIKDIVGSYNEVLTGSEWNHSSEDYALYEKNQRSRDSFLRFVCYKKSIAIYYLQRVFLQVLLAAMVLFATYSIAQNVYGRSLFNESSSGVER